MEKQSRVSVLMSVYNGERYLREAVESILNQTFGDFEFIIVNDGSTDRTAEILRGFDDERMILIDNPHNIGLTRSLNKGLRMARGEYIARMDADDISLPMRLERQAIFLDDHREVGLVGSFYYEIAGDGREVGIIELYSENDEIQKHLLERNYFCHGTTVFRRSCLEEVGFYREEFKTAQDYDLWLRIAEKFEVANLTEPLYMRRFNLASITMTSVAEQEAYRALASEAARERQATGQDRLDSLSKNEILRAVADNLSRDILKRRQLMSNVYCHWGNQFLKIGDYRNALRLLAKSGFYYPLNRTLWLLVLSVIYRRFKAL